MPFTALGLVPALAQAAAELGFTAPTPIQQAAIPAVLQGKDVLATAQTGSGKTAAFGLAGLARIDWENPDPQMLVICPTRELAVQVCAEIQRLVVERGRGRSSGSGRLWYLASQ